MDLRFEQFPALSAIPICRHVFTQRIPGIDVSHDKAEVIRRLDAAHREIRCAIGVGDWPLLTAQQIHGNEIAVVDEVGSALRADRGRSEPDSHHSAASLPSREFPGRDGMITNQRGTALGVHVADCCAVYIVDPKTPAIGLVHSGRKGTELGVVTNAIQQMRDRFSSDPANLIVQLSPCIRPPHYEVDFAAEIVRQCRALGVREIHDSGVCTACDLDRYYSYRAEKGKTGRMLALIGLKRTIDN
jgi:purine-nucleoside/S-methyl-5'-thioadenosine phosphorylase / adenosine deaminase